MQVSNPPDDYQITLGERTFRALKKKPSRTAEKAERPKFIMLERARE